jgi:cell division protein FtsA
LSSSSRFIGAVEIGTSKVSVLIGEIVAGRSVNLIGYGECQSHGVVKGVVTDFKAASDATHSASLAAEQSAGIKIQEVYLAQTGRHLEGFYNQASVSVGAANNMVTQLDIDTVCRLAKAKALPDGRMVVHHIRRPFQLDGKLVGANPEHLNGERLEVGYWTVHGHEPMIANSIHVVRGFNVRVSDLILSSLASGTMLTTPQDRQHGALVIDVGAGTTDYVLYRDGSPFMTGVIPVGGAHLTNDLALGLRVTEGQAEKLKLRHGRGTVVTHDKQDKVWLNGDFAIGDRQFPRHAIETITSARVRELFEVVQKKLGTALVAENCAAGVVLTGGTSKLPGIADAAARIFDLPTHLGEMPPGVDEKLREPAHSTVLGLLHFGLQNRSTPQPRHNRGRGLLRKLFTVGT